MAGLSWISLFGQQPKSLRVSLRHQWVEAGVGCCIPLCGAQMVLGERGEAEGTGHLSGYCSLSWHFFCLSRLLPLGEAA